MSDEAPSVRRVRATDAEVVRALDVALIRDGRGEVRSLGDLQAVAGYRARCADPSRLHWVVELDGRIIGQAQLHPLPVARARHVASCSVGIHPEAQGRGLGRRLMEHVVAEAWRRGIHRLELYVRSDNERARRLYASLGFETESVRRDFVLLDDGSFLDDLCMVCFRPVEHVW